MLKTIIRTVAKYLLAMSVLSYVIFASWAPADGRGLSDVWHRHVIEGQPIDGVCLLFAFIFHAFSLVITLLRWYLLVRAQDLPFTVLGAMRLGTLGFLFNAFLPGSVGGDVVKAAALARGQSRQTVAVATVIMDRALSLWGLILLVAVVGSACWLAGAIEDASLAPARVAIVASVVSLGLSGSLWLLMGVWPSASTVRIAERLDQVPRIGGSLAQLWQVVWLYRSRPASIAWAIVLCTVSNVCDVFAFYLYVLALCAGLLDNPLPSLTDHFLLVPVGLVISAIPLFPGGAGIGEAGFGGLYILFGSAGANGVLGSLIFRVSGWIIGILGYVVFSVIDTGPGPANRNG